MKSLALSGLKAKTNIFLDKVSKREISNFPQELKPDFKTLIIEQDKAMEDSDIKSFETTNTTIQLNSMQQLMKNPKET